MATKNQRVAAYLPPLLSQKFSEFKQENHIEGDSEAIIRILSDYLGVAQQVYQSVTYHSNSGLLERIKTLEDKFETISNTIDSLERIKIEIKNELISDLLTNTANNVVEGQLTLLPHESSDNDLLPLKPSELKLQPLAEKEFCVRLGVARYVAGNQRRFCKDVESFSAWTQKKDPDQISWTYNATDKKYHPIQNTPGSLLYELPSES